MTEPLLTEDPEGDRTWITRWFCEPPPLHARFRVFPGGDEWHDEAGVPCRDIYRIEMVPGIAGRGFGNDRVVLDEACRPAIADPEGMNAAPPDVTDNTRNQ